MIDMSDYKTITDRNVQAQLELIDKQAKLLEAMMKPTVTVTEKTLRDEFAMAALTGLLQQGYDKFDPSEWSNQAYAYADAMMETRK